MLELGSRAPAAQACLLLVVEVEEVRLTMTVLLVGRAWIDEKVDLGMPKAAAAHSKIVEAAGCASAVVGLSSEAAGLKQQKLVARLRPWTIAEASVEERWDQPLS